jgi:phage tail-like protein
MDDIYAVFRILGPEVERRMIEVTRAGMVFGRAAGNDVTLRDSQISRRHMRIIWQDGGFWVEDMGSSNGVWLNNARLEANVLRAISPSDNIRLGPYTLVYEQLVTPLGAGAGVSSTMQPESPPARVPTPVMPRLDELVPVRPRDIQPQFSMLDSLVPRVRSRNNNHYIQGIPRDQSNWLQYLPGLYSDPSLDPTHFMGRYLLIFETLLSPIIWMVDNFDLYLSSETAPAEWLQWMASWFDLLLLPELPIENQRAIMRQIGWLFLRRGTRLGLERLLELYFGAKPEIVENAEGDCHFTVRLPLSQSETRLGRDVAERLIASQKPAFTAFTLEVT